MRFLVLVTAGSVGLAIAASVPPGTSFPADFTISDEQSKALAVSFLAGAEIGGDRAVLDFMYAAAIIRDQADGNPAAKFLTQAAAVYGEASKILHHSSKEPDMLSDLYQILEDMAKQLPPGMSREVYEAPTLGFVMAFFAAMEANRKAEAAAKSPKTEKRDDSADSWPFIDCSKCDQSDPEADCQIHCVRSPPKGYGGLGQILEPLEQR